ncbi:L,D-transpeptidase family protein [Streptomyces sp. NPDC006785]|uniref:L,D-transpeptidase family protein n=1 Tax=Streptomyces sp. NPDC006785 TaxID=3155461 RepID=UPI0034088BA1
MVDADSGWHGRGGSNTPGAGSGGTHGAGPFQGRSGIPALPDGRSAPALPGRRSTPALPDHRSTPALPGRRVAAASLVALAALATGCEPGTATGAQDAPPPARATRAAAPTASPATEDAKPPTAPTPSPPASTTPPAPTPTPEPARTTARPAPEPSTAPAPRILMRTGSESDRVRELQARLRQIGHFGRNPTGYYGSVTAASVRSFQTKRSLPVTGSTDEVTWRRLLGMTRVPTAAELRPPTERPVAAPDERCLKGRVLCISKNSRTLAWMIDGTVVSAMDVRFGSEYTPTREGVFEVFWKSRDHVSTLYDTPMPYALFFSGGQAVHYSADFAANGYGGASHGCVNVRDKKKVAALFDQVRTGDKVVVYW